MPDVTFTHRDDFPPDFDDDEAAPLLPPTIAVEVVSDGNTDAEVEMKTREYFESGARLVWLVYPDQRRVRVHTSPTDHRDLTGHDTLDAGDVLPTFNMKVADLLDG